MLIDREILPLIKESVKSYGVISLTGPRQSGKTTLAKLAFPHHSYVNLEDLVTLRRISDDPKGFIDNVDNGVVIDEIQRYPDLLSFIQVSIDENYIPGKFVITGSQNLLVTDKISQSLAGRVAIFTLLPLTMSELSSSDYLASNVNEVILDGFYPGRFTRNINKKLFYSSYLETYVERDVRSLTNIGDLTNFKRFLSVIAGRVGQLANYSSIANDIGVSNKTVESWMSILEASYITFRLTPYYKNHGKRVIKSPKVYFHDVGLLAYLLELDSVSELKTHFAMGAIFENLIISDILKSKYNTLSSSNLYFWRDREGHEVDLVISSGAGESLIEIKAGESYNSDYLKNIEYLKKISGKSSSSYIVYSGKEESTVRGNKLLNWKNIESLKKELL